MSQSRVTVKDIRASGHCVTGLKDFCGKHGLSLEQLVREGIPVSDLDQIDDANLKLVLDKVKERESKNG